MVLQDERKTVDEAFSQTFNHVSRADPVLPSLRSQLSVAIRVGMLAVDGRLELLPRPRAP